MDYRLLLAESCSSGKAGWEAVPDPKRTLKREDVRLVSSTSLSLTIFQLWSTFVWKHINPHFPFKVARFYNKRGTAEQWIKEGKIALTWTRLSCHSFRDNEVRLQLFALAYNLGNFLRRLVLPRKIKHWTLTTLREKLIKIGVKVIRHAHILRFNWPR